MNPHEAMDDTGDHAMQLHTEDGGYRLDTHRPLPKGLDCQGRYPHAAEACTELGADDDTPHVSGAISWPVWIVLGIALVSACWHFSELLP